MDVTETRRRKTQQLARNLTGGHESGFREIAEKMEWSQSLTSQLLGVNASRKITDKRAREIESQFDKERGWLDNADVPAGSDGLDEALLLDCMRAVRAEMTTRSHNLSHGEADDLLIRAAIILYRFSREAGQRLSAGAALDAAGL